MVLKTESVVADDSKKRYTLCTIVALLILILTRARHERPHSAGRGHGRSQWSQVTPRSHTFGVGVTPTALVAVQNATDISPKSLSPCSSPKAHVSCIDAGYTYLYQVIDALAAVGVTSLLSKGSFLGAARHGGIIPFAEKDLDVAVFSTNEILIESVLNGIRKLHWRTNHDGMKDKSVGFGYHLDPPGTKLYIDLWLFERRDGKVRCVGGSGGIGCDAWYTHWIKYNPTGIGPTYEESDWFPPRALYFGRRKLLVPGTTAQLDLLYPGWKTVCGGKQAFHKNRIRSCASLRDNTHFSPTFLLDTL